MITRAAVRGYSNRRLWSPHPSFLKPCVRAWINLLLPSLWLSEPLPLPMRLPRPCHSKLPPSFLSSPFSSQAFASAARCASHSMTTSLWQTRTGTAPEHSPLRSRGRACISPNANPEAVREGAQATLQAWISPVYEGRTWAKKPISVICRDTPQACTGLLAQLPVAHPLSSVHNGRVAIRR
jgi:hypothetical protein